MASLYTEPSVQPVAQLLVRAGAHCDICIIRSASVYDKQRSERERGGSKDAPEMTLYVEIKAAHIVSIHGFVHINILSLTIFQVQLCPRSSSSWCGVWVLFSSSYQCVAFRLKEYCTQTDLILSMTHLWTFLAPPYSGCTVYFFFDGWERNHCYHGSNDYCFAVSLLWAFFFFFSPWCPVHVKRVELLNVTDMEKALSGLWLEVLLCLSYTTLSSHTDTAPISAICFKACGLFSTAYEPQL